jgi:hypothetical protein
VKTKTKPKRSSKKSKPVKRAAAKPVARKRRVAARRPPAKRRRAARRPRQSKWVTLVAKHGVVLASAHGPVPTFSEVVAGEPIVGTWWAHPKGRAIFAALGELDDSEDVRCFKLIDHKVTYVHRRLWAALACLAQAGGLAADQVASIQQEHMPTGEHRTIVTPLADWVDEHIAREAAALTPATARAQLGAWAA